MSETIVPFVDAAAKRKHDEDGPMEAIENILHAMEGMEAQIHSLIQLVSDQDRRIRELEKAGKSKIIKVAS